MNASVLEVQDLVKRFGSTTVLKSINLDLRAGDFIGLMGPNGAGKSTLIKILDGLYEPDGGNVAIDGKLTRSLRGRPEIRVIHQDLGLVDDLSVWENLRLGRRAVRKAWGFLDHAEERRLAVRELKRVELDLDPELTVKELSSAERTLVAVARALAEGAELLVLDEATSTLPTAEAARLMARMRDVAASGTAVLMVSHKLNEILDGPDRIVVLIDGQIVTDVDRGSLDRAGLVRLLMEHEESESRPRARVVPGDVLVACEAASARGCGPFDLEIRRGEVVGLTGSPGSGMHDIALLVAGYARLSAGRKSTLAGLRTAIVPASREAEGGFLDLTTRENLTISSVGRKWRTPLGLLSLAKERSESGRLLSQLAVVPAGPEEPFSPLSGGNKQKVIFGRARLSDPDLYVLCEPSRGVDVATRRQIYQIIRNVVDEGRAGILVVSADYEDLAAVCDRVAVVIDGELGAFTPVTELSNSAMEGVL